MSDLTKHSVHPSQLAARGRKEGERGGGVTGRARVGRGVHRRGSRVTLTDGRTPRKDENDLTALDFVCQRAGREEKTAPPPRGGCPLDGGARSSSPPLGSLGWGVINILG